MANSNQFDLNIFGIQDNTVTWQTTCTVLCVTSKLRRCFEQVVIKLANVFEFNVNEFTNGFFRDLKFVVSSDAWLKFRGYGIKPHVSMAWNDYQNLKLQHFLVWILISDWLILNCTTPRSILYYLLWNPIDSSFVQLILHDNFVNSSHAPICYLFIRTKWFQLKDFFLLRYVFSPAISESIFKNLQEFFKHF